MARAFTPKVITANHLLEGDVIYMTDTGEWTRQMAEAVLLTDEADADVRLIEAQQQAATTVGVYLADAKADENGNPSPTHFREEFRRVGPSNYFHGKQAEA
ncbi:DUF2849 domain-containing protein [Cognatishimia sp. WU-CL00825]|uniref:DUF2849 domain-containing protein n=1 Tax=Cognatishimia sp. WU-CL00825 TaxID=3127658 RepID=UPI003109FFE1